MKLTAKVVLTKFFARLQRAYARVIRSGAPRVPHPGIQGPVGGSLADAVQRRDLVQVTDRSGLFTPSKLGVAFRLWWRGTKRQQARGRDVPIDEQALVRELEQDLARQLEAWDRRTS